MSKAILPGDRVSAVLRGLIVYIVSDQHKLAVIATIHNVEQNHEGHFIAPALPKVWMDRQRHV